MNLSKNVSGSSDIEIGETERTSARLSKKLEETFEKHVNTNGVSKYNKKYRAPRHKIQQKTLLQVNKTYNTKYDHFVEGERIRGRYPGIRAKRAGK